MIQFALYTTTGGPLFADYSGSLEKPTFARNEHGDAEASGFVPMGAQEAFQLYDLKGLLHVVFADQSSDAIYEGRLEDVQITGDGVTLRAFGYARALSDAPYTALWSMTDVTKFRPLTTEEVSSRAPESYTFDTNGRVQIALNKNATWATNTSIGSMVYQMPDKGSRQIVGISFDLVVALPLNWRFQIITWQSGYLSGTSAYIYTGTTAIESLNRFITVSGCDYVEFAVYNATGSPYPNTDETSRWKATITNIRLVTATTNAVNTTSTALVSIGSNVSVPVVTTANMYVGQRLHLGIPASLGIAATVKTIPDATHFTADLVSGMASGGNVQAFVIYADEIAKDMLSSISTLNPTQLSSATGFVQSPALDLLNESFQDQYPADILDYLITRGDTQVPPRQWEWGVTTGRRLYFRPQGAAARVWYVDINDIDIRRTIDELFNSLYATYQDASGRTLRSAISTDAASVARYGITRRKAFGVQTPSLTQALVQRDAELADTKDPKPRSGITVRQISAANGGDWPLSQVRPGDTVVMRNLPPTLSTAIDRIRTFRITRTELDLDANDLTVEPESPLPTLATLLARATPPSWVTTPWWLQVQQP